MENQKYSTIELMGLSHLEWIHTHHSISLESHVGYYCIYANGLCSIIHNCARTTLMLTGYDPITEHEYGRITILIRQFNRVIYVYSRWMIYWFRVVVDVKWVILRLYGNHKWFYVIIMLRFVKQRYYNYNNLIEFYVKEFLTFIIINSEKLK